MKLRTILLLAILLMASSVEAARLHDLLTDIIGGSVSAAPTLICTNCVEGQPSLLVLNSTDCGYGCPGAGWANGAYSWGWCTWDDWDDTNYWTWSWLSSDYHGGVDVTYSPSNGWFNVRVSYNDSSLLVSNVPITCDTNHFLCGNYHLTYTNQDNNPPSNGVESLDLVLGGCGQAPSTNGVCYLSTVQSNVMLVCGGSTNTFSWSGIQGEYLTWTNSIGAAYAVFQGSNTFWVEASSGGVGCAAGCGHLGAQGITLSCINSQLCGAVAVHDNFICAVPNGTSGTITFGTGVAGCSP